jgi:hypothetical protein
MKKMTNDERRMTKEARRLEHLSVLCALSVSLFALTSCGFIEGVRQSNNNDPANRPAAGAAPIAVVGNDFTQSAVEVLQDIKDYQSGDTGWLYTLEKGLHAYSTVTKTYADAKDVLKQFTATKGKPWVDRLLAVLQKKPNVPLETKMTALAQLSESVAKNEGP